MQATQHLSELVSSSHILKWGGKTGHVMHTDCSRGIPETWWGRLWYVSTPEVFYLVGQYNEEEANISVIHIVTASHFYPNRDKKRTREESYLKSLGYPVRRYCLTECGAEDIEQNCKRLLDTKKRIVFLFSSGSPIFLQWGMNMKGMHDFLRRLVLDHRENIAIFALSAGAAVFGPGVEYFRPYEKHSVADVPVQDGGQLFSWFFFPHVEHPDSSESYNELPGKFQTLGHSTLALQDGHVISVCLCNTCLG